MDKDIRKLLMLDEKKKKRTWLSPITSKKLTELEVEEPNYLHLLIYNTMWNVYMDENMDGFISVKKGARCMFSCCVLVNS